ncbi:MAG: hypothetical protein R3C99_00975 [Pirellulaceae bacterium]
MAAGHDHPQIASPPQQAMQKAQQKVDVQRPFVGFVDDDRVVLIQEPIVLGFGQ